MLLAGLVILSVLAVVGVPWWAFYGFIGVGFLLWVTWTWVKIWAVKKTENQ